MWFRVGCRNCQRRKLKKTIISLINLSAVKENPKEMVSDRISGIVQANCVYKFALGFQRVCGIEICVFNHEIIIFQ